MDTGNRARGVLELRRLLDEKGWSYQDLIDHLQHWVYTNEGSQSLSLTPAYVSEWLRGKRGISRRNAFLINKVLDIPIEWFEDRRTIKAVRAGEAGRDLSVPSAAFSAESRYQPASAGGYDQRADDVARRLMDLVRDQWKAEARRLQLLDPHPLAIACSKAPGELMDHPEVIANSHMGAGNCFEWEGPMEVNAVAQAFRRLPRRRLVVLGKAGAGKTTLLILLTLALIESPEPGDPVPVLLSLSSWNPRQLNFEHWVRRRLREDYPSLRDAIEHLVTQGRVLVLLDGLDEMAEELRTVAIEKINQIGADLPLVIACRAHQYAVAVENGDVLTAADVINLGPLQVPAVIHYLRLTTPPGLRSNRWESVFQRLCEDPGTPLAAALSTPLMVSLARARYTTKAADPRELLDPARFPTKEAIEDHLLDGLIPALQEANRSTARGPSKEFDSELALRWLRNLAIHLQKRHTYDLAWWELIPGPQLRLSVMLLAGLLVMLTPGIIFGFKTVFGFGTLFGFGILVGTILGILAGIMFGFLATEGLRGGPTHITLRLGPSTLPAVLGLGTGIVLAYLAGIRAGLGFGFILAALLWLAARLRPLSVIVIGLGGGVTMGSLVGIFVRLGLVHKIPNGIVAPGLDPGLASGFEAGLTTSFSYLLAYLVISRVVIDSDKMISPASTLRGDRTAFVLTTLMLGIMFGFLARSSLVSTFGAGIMFGLAGGLAVGAHYRWPWFQLTCITFAIRGQLPLRLMPFLYWAHQVGILRQVGAVYQFRHARLQKRLAAGVGRHSS